MTTEQKTAWIDHIPVLWLEPQYPPPIPKLVIFLTGLSGSKSDVLPYLTELALEGYFALSFDSWEHGERTSMSSDEILTHTFGNFRRHMWVTIGQTALDTLRVIDWAVETLGVDPQVRMGGLSMGGDIAVAAAGIDPRIRRVAAVGSTPDWKRPGMKDLRDESHPVLPSGTPDAYARAFYERLNPITNLGHYAAAPYILFANGAEDDHVPPEASLRFKAELADLYPQAAENVTVSLIPGADHNRLFGAKDQWWPLVQDWFWRPV
jgi:dienelactone hydrolase